MLPSATLESLFTERRALERREHELSAFIAEYPRYVTQEAHDDLAAAQTRLAAIQAQLDADERARFTVEAA